MIEGKRVQVYKLMIIEDEELIRKAIINEIDWKSIDCNVVGDTGNGTVAVDLINGLRPDIIISDIRIDGIDGLQVCRYVYDNFPETRIILITAYGELDYAQAAIKLEISDFILKPIDPDELIAAVQKAIRNINKKRQRNEDFIKLQQIVENSIPLLREKFLLELSNNLIPDKEEFKQKVEFLGLDMEKFIVFTLEIDNYEVFLNKYSEKDRQSFKLAIKQISEKIISLENEGYYFQREPNFGVIIINIIQGTDVTDMAEMIQKSVSDRFNISLSIGISLFSRDLKRLGQSIEEAAEALRHKFYCGNGSIICYSDIRNTGEQHYTNLTVYYNAIINALKIGDSDNAITQMDMLEEIIKKEVANDESYVKNVAIELVILIQNSLKNDNIKVENFIHSMNLYSGISKCETILEIFNMIRDSIVQISRFINLNINSNNRAVVDRIIRYIESNYSQDLSLNDIGQVVYMNPKYVCQLIRKETGETFTDILARVRIEKAKEMMKDIRYKIYEIAGLVGINDSRYFSQIFKKITGLSPSEYRSKFQI